MINVAEIEAIRAIGEALESVSDAALLREGSRMKEVGKGEKAIGILHNDTTKRVFIAAKRAQAAGNRDVAASDVVDTDEQENALMASYRRSQALALLLMALFKYQAADELVGFAEIGNNGGLEIRKDWMVVAPKEKSNMPPQLARVLGIEVDED